MYCRPSYNVLFVIILLFFYLFLIVRRPWPNFVCKGRHTSSVVLYCIVLPLSTDSAVEMLHDSALYKFMIDIDITLLRNSSFAK